MFCIFWWSWRQCTVKSILANLPIWSKCSQDAFIFRANLLTCLGYRFFLIKHNQLENISDVEIWLQSLVFLFMWLTFSFSQGTEFLIQQSSLTSTAGCVMIQNISKESFERTITIAKGNSSLGKFLIFHIYLLSYPSN